MNNITDEYLDARICTKEDVKNEKHPAVLSLKDWSDLQKKTLDSHQIEYLQEATNEACEVYTNINNVGISDIVYANVSKDEEDYQAGYEAYLDYLTDDLYDSDYATKQLIKLEFKSMDEAKEYYGSYWNELAEVFEGNLKEW